MPGPVIKWGLAVSAMVVASLIVWQLTGSSKDAPNGDNIGSGNIITGSGSVIVGDQYTFSTVENVDLISEVVLIREDIRLPVPFSKTAESQLSITIPQGTEPGEYDVELVRENGEVEDLGQQLLVDSPTGLAAAPPETPMTTTPITPTPRPTDIPTSSGPSNGQEIRFGSIVTGEVSHPLTTISYSYQGRANERVLIRMLRISGEVNPQLRIYYPDGSPHCSGAQGSPAYALMELECTLDVDGTYAFVTSDFGGDDTGEFSLIVQGTSAPLNGSPLPWGEPADISIPNPLAIGTFVIPGRTSERVLIRLSPTSGEIAPQFRVYRPDGTLLCSAYLFAQALLERECVLDADGPHTILTTDLGADATGQFALLVIRTN